MKAKAYKNGKEFEFNDAKGAREALEKDGYTFTKPKSKKN